MHRWIACLALAACSRTLPAPMMAFHGDTSADPEGATSAMLVLGVAGPRLVDGVGVALRVEHQDTTRRATGLEITGGSDGVEWLIAARGYVRHTPRSRDWVAATYGIGLSYMSVGLVAGSVHAGGALSYFNDSAQPFLATGLALVMPLRQATRDWHPPHPCREERDHLVKLLNEEDEPDRCTGPGFDRTIPSLATELFFVLDGGFAVPIGATGHQLSLDIGVAKGLLGDNKIVSASLAERYTFDQASD